MKPNLFIPGFPKSGTSSLHSMLCEHPEISEGETKEPHTYSWDNRYRHRLSYFVRNKNPTNSTYLLDSSTSYMISRYAINRIVDETPSAKFLVIARDPIDRIISHYNWLSNLGFVNKFFEEEITEQIGRKFNYKYHYNGNYKFYVEFSKYGEQYEHLKTLVPENQFLFLTFEDVFSQWVKYSKKIGAFLNLNLEEIQVRTENRTAPNSSKENKNEYSLKKYLLQEYSYLRGKPRGLKIKDPIFNKVERVEVENFLFPLLKEDLLKLKSYNLDLSSWRTSHNL